ncbi:MAG: anaerobic ribonucleoside-triphosphate reductase activating protein [Candidatus Hydrothermarchaeaceae archaeon]
MLVKGLQKTTLIDFPGKVASVIFLAGCNLRCPYCQNPGLIEEHEELPDIPEEEVFRYIKSRKNWLDGVCISGGEPTINPELPEFLEKIKKTGLLVKLDTNGTEPKMLEKLVKRKLVDYIAMDIKAPLKKYRWVVRAKIDLGKIEKSVEIIRESGIDYEFRTTVVPSLLTRRDILEIGAWLKGAKRYYLHQFRPQITLDKAFQDEKPYKLKGLNSFRDAVNGCFELCEVRA